MFDYSQHVSPATRWPRVYFVPFSSHIGQLIPVRKWAPVSPLYPSGLSDCQPLNCCCEQHAEFTHGLSIRSSAKALNSLIMKGFHSNFFRLSPGARCEEETRGLVWLSMHSALTLQSGTFTIRSLSSRLQQLSWMGGSWLILVNGTICFSILYHHIFTILHCFRCCFSALYRDNWWTTPYLPCNTVLSTVSDR